MYCSCIEALFLEVLPSKKFLPEHGFRAVCGIKYEPVNMVMVVAMILIPKLRTVLVSVDRCFLNFPLTLSSPIMISLLVPSAV